MSTITVLPGMLSAALERIGDGQPGALWSIEASDGNEVVHSVDLGSTPDGFREVVAVDGLPKDEFLSISIDVLRNPNDAVGVGSGVFKTEDLPSDGIAAFTATAGVDPATGQTIPLDVMSPEEFRDVATESCPKGFLSVD